MIMVFIYILILIVVILFLLKKKKEFFGDAPLTFSNVFSQYWDQALFSVDRRSKCIDCDKSSSYIHPQKCLTCESVSS